MPSDCGKDAKRSKQRGIKSTLPYGATTVSPPFFGPAFRAPFSPVCLVYAQHPFNRTFFFFFLTPSTENSFCFFLAQATTFLFVSSKLSRKETWI